MWTEKASAGFVSLAYGPLDPAKAPLLLLSCFDAMGIAVLDVRTEMTDAKPGRALTIELSAGDAKSSVEGEAAFDDASGVIFGEASDIAVKPVLEVLRQSGPVTVTIGEANATLVRPRPRRGGRSIQPDCEWISDRPARQRQARRTTSARADVLAERREHGGDDACGHRGRPRHTSLAACSAR